MHKSLPPLHPPQAPLPCSNHTVWPPLPIATRQPCHERMAPLRIHVSPRAPSAAWKHAHHAEPAPSPT